MAHAVPLEAVQMEMQGHPSGVLLRTVVIGLTAFLTVVDLFATQAILPSLARAYNVTGGHGLCRQFEHHGHGSCWTGRLSVQSADQSPPWHSD